MKTKERKPVVPEVLYTGDDPEPFAAYKAAIEQSKDVEALYPTIQDIDAHNDNIATMLELVQRNQELKTALGTMAEEMTKVIEINTQTINCLNERVRELENHVRRLLRGYDPENLTMQSVYHDAKKALEGE